MNTNEAAGQGKHWLAFYVPSGLAKIEKFDSVRLFRDFSLLDQSFIHFSSRNIQACNTNVCKHYELLFIYLISRCQSVNNRFINLENNFTDASAVRKLLDLSF